MVFFSGSFTLGALLSLMCAEINLLTHRPSPRRDKTAFFALRRSAYFVLLPPLTLHNISEWMFNPMLVML